jgi:hypothetical protein
MTRDPTIKGGRGQGKTAAGMRNRGLTAWRRDRRYADKADLTVTRIRGARENAQCIETMVDVPPRKWTRN